MFIDFPAHANAHILLVQYFLQYLLPFDKEKECVRAYRYILRREVVAIYDPKISFKLHKRHLAIS